MKKGQFVGQIFVYVLMIIVFAAVLLFGFTAIKNLMDRGSQIEIKNFEIELKKLITSNMHYDTKEIKILSIPGDYREICFIDNCAYDTGAGYCTDISVWLDESSWGKYGSVATSVPGYSHSAIKDSLDSYSKSNVYLYPKKKNDDFQVGPLVVYHQCEVYTDSINDCPLPGNAIDIDPVDPANPSATLKIKYAADTTASHQKFNCMPIVDGKVRVKVTGFGNKVEIIQLPFV